MSPTLAIAGHEVRRATAFLDRRSVPALLALLLLAALGGPLAAQRLDAQAGLYPVGVAPGSPYAGAVAADGRFTVVAGASQADLGPRIALWLGQSPHAAPDERGRAALEALAQATQRWLDGRLAEEGDQAAAFPVTVNLVSTPRDPAFQAPAPPPPSPPGAPGSPAPPPAAPPPLDVAASAPAGAERTLDVTPREVQPPFPVESLLLTFAYLIPLNFVAQLHAGSLLGERTRHRTVLLLASPARPWQVLAGRSLPYAALALLLWAAAGLAVGVDWLGAVAALVVVAFVLCVALLLGLLARSPRELTFLLTGATTMLATFLFLPAIFTALPPVAFLSPVAVVSASIDGRPVTPGAFLYATLPLALLAASLAALSLGLARDETLHSQRGLAHRVGEALRRLVATRRALFLGGVLAVPFAFVLQLFLLTSAVPLGLAAAIPAIILGAALVEEALKQALSRAHRLAGAGRRGRPAWATGLLAGSGFFLGEKLALLVGLVGFGLLPSGKEAVAALGGGTGLLLLAPLALHTVTAAVGAAGTGRGNRVWTLLALLAAWGIHLLYNLAILQGAWT